MTLNSRTSARFVVALLSTLLSMLAIATVAQAEWKIEGKTFPGLGIEEESAFVIMDGEFRYLVPSLALDILCKGIDGEGTLKLKGFGGVKLTFLSCGLIYLSIGGECPVKDFIIDALSKVVLHKLGESTATFVLFSPLPGMTTILTYTVENCPFTTKNAVGGSFAVAIGAEDVDQKFDLGNAEVENLLGDGPKFGTREAIFDGTLLMVLDGAHEFQSWGAV